eukprot:jgi/Pico_ML_1/51527/g210.t1
MAKDGNLRVLLHVLHKGVGTSWNHQIYHIFKLQQVRHTFTGLYNVDQFRTHIWFQCFVDHFKQRSVRAGSLFATLQQEAIPGSDSKGSNLRKSIRASFENDKHDANG